MLGDILLGHTDGRAVRLTPGACQPVARRLGTSLWRTGVRVFTGTHEWGRTAAHTDDIQRCANYLEPRLGADWVHGALRMDGTRLRGAETRALTTPTRADGLTFCEEWLPYCSSDQDEWLIDEAGGHQAGRYTHGGGRHATPRCLCGAGKGQAL
ncbi:hypothetical protein PybrP1_006548 [[Pythium] brassicae (nom. inval.)]|nr:hypothetical protein PybrP1_006548 [[Pythium] brassicae (nom. inval.)]